MRKYLASNDTHQITIPLIVGAEYTVSTSNGRLTVRSNNIDTISEVTTDGGSEVTIELNTPVVPVGSFSLINYLIRVPTAVGVFQKRETLGVVDLLDIPATPDDVRNELGLDPEELSDEAIDYVEPYLKYYANLDPQFHTDRQTNEYLTKKFGDLIAVRAALDVAPTLINRLDKKRGTENGEVTRLGSAADLVKLIESLQDKLRDILEDLSEYVTVETETMVPVFQFVSMYQHSTGQ